MSRPDKPLELDNYHHTSAEDSVYTLLWKIDNFKRLKSASSASFTNKSAANLYWKLEIVKQEKLLGKYERKLEHIFLLRLLESPQRQYAKEQLDISLKLSLSADEKLGYFNSIERSISIDAPFRQVYNLDEYKSPKNDLIVICEIEVLTGAPAVVKCLDVSVRELSKDFSLLLNDRRHSDVIIVSGDKELAAHKAILSARCSVFESMFKHSIKENQSRVTENDIDSNIVEALLEFIYTDKVKNIKQVAEGLLVAADKYQLDKLKWMCEQALLENSTGDNASPLNTSDHNFEARWKYILTELAQQQ